MNKIITHAGQFHADEVLAVAILREFGYNAPVERQFKLTDDVSDDVMVIDFGQVYDGNYRLDHHQDKTLPASNVLVARWLVAQGNIDPKVYKHLEPFLMAVSDVDTGIVPNGGNPSGLNAIIRAFNPAGGSPQVFDDAFEIALQLARQIISKQIKVCKKIVEDETRWAGLERIANGKVAIQEDTNMILGWKDWAKETGERFLVCPSLREGWQVISRDSEEFAVPPHESQIFRHASSFMAVYLTREDAINHAVSIT